MNAIVLILIDLLVIGIPFIIWLFIAVYISKIKKYKYDNKYNYWWDRFKFIWTIIMYLSIMFSFFLVNEVFEQEFISRITLFIFLLLILIMISIVLLLRTTHNKERLESIFNRFKTPSVELIRKAIQITNVLMMLYYLFFLIFVL